MWAVLKRAMKNSFYSFCMYGSILFIIPGGILGAIDTFYFHGFNHFTEYLLYILGFLSLTVIVITQIMLAYRSLRVLGTRAWRGGIVIWGIYTVGAGFYLFLGGRHGSQVSIRDRHAMYQDLFNASGIELLKLVGVILIFGFAAGLLQFVGSLGVTFFAYRDQRR